ncbi:MAG: hypothetical protein HDR09_14460 [Lachnospiraceae bacterium]|nr:hypothetical protein [Lachnospiraceae bacterium]
MKRKTLGRILAASLALTMVFGGTMTPAITAKADLKIPGEGDSSQISDGRHPEEGDSNEGDSGTTTEDLGRTEGNQFNSGSGNGSSSGSDSNSGNDDVPYGSSSGDSASYDGGNSDTANTVSSQTFAATVAGLTSKGNTVTISGYETWRQEASAVSGTFTVYHKGIKQYTLQLKDKDGSAVSYKSAGIIQSEDGKYYINIVTAGGVDTTGWTVATVKGTSAYLPRLGVSGVCINGTVAVDAESAAAAAE